MWEGLGEGRETGYKGRNEFRECYSILSKKFSAGLSFPWFLEQLVHHKHVVMHIQSYFSRPITNISSFLNSSEAYTKLKPSCFSAAITTSLSPFPRHIFNYNHTTLLVPRQQTLSWHQTNIHYHRYRYHSHYFHYLRYRLLFYYCSRCTKFWRDR